MKLTLPEPPSANRYWRHAKGRTYLSAEALAYRDAVLRAWASAKTTQRLLRKTGLRRMVGPISFTFTWYRGRKSGDLDNRTKQLCDALRGYAYEDDSQIVELHAYRVDRPRNPGVEVTIEHCTPKES